MLEPLKVTIQNFDKVLRLVFHFGYLEFHEIRVEKIPWRIEAWGI